MGTKLISPSANFVGLKFTITWNQNLIAKFLDDYGRLHCRSPPVAIQIFENPQSPTIFDGEMTALRSHHRVFNGNAGMTWAARSLQQPSNTCIFCQSTRTASRRFAWSARQNQEGGASSGGPFRTRLRASLKKTKVEWKPIPVALGISFLGAVQFYRIRRREQRRQSEEDEEVRSQDEGHGSEEEEKGKPKKRKRIKPSGPW